jgi:ADP-heptose:LPS heptosyltransferase
MAASRSANTFLQRTREARKIIVVDFGFLGDSVHLVPALWEIKRNYPQAQLHTLSASVGAELLKLAPCVDRVHAFPLTAKSPAWWRHWGIIAALRREHFDAAFNFSGADRTIFVTAALGARHVLAHEAGRKHFWNRWLSAEWVERRERNQPVFEQRRQVLAAAGFPLAAPRFDFCVPEDARRWAEGAIADKPVHLAISASTPVKEWPLENWAGLVRMMAQQKPSIRMIATAGTNPREQERLRQLARSAGTAQLQCFDTLAIPQLAALLQRCRLQIGADSGVLHLAMALGVPTLTVFRQYAGMEEWVPAGSQHRHLAAVCRCIDENKDDCLKAGRAACLAGISPAQVFAQACPAL